MPPLIKKTQIGEVVAYVQRVDSDEDQEKPNVNPAIITQVREDDYVDLFVMHSNGSYHLHNVPKGSVDHRGSWYFIRLKDGANG